MSTKKAIGEKRPEKTETLAPAWQPGQSGNPAGRPKGSRNKLTEGFIAALCEDFEVHGVKVIETVREDDPADYLRLIARVVAPVRVAISTDAVGDWDDDELRQAAVLLRERLRASANGAMQ